MKAKLIKSPNGEHYYLTVDGKKYPFWVQR